MMFYLYLIIKYIAMVLPLLIAIAYFTLTDRKIMGAAQRRQGPNVVGLYGLLQPLADGIKLVVKENIVPIKANKFLFYLAPIFSFMISLTNWTLIPINSVEVLVNLNLGLLYLFASSSLGVYGLIISGWSSNSKYPLLGAIRAAAQMISYEISIGLILVTVAVCAGSYNLQEIVKTQEYMWYIFPLFPLFIIFRISSLAETNRAPFDLAEAEAESVAGFNVEYSGISFALFFLAEYSNMLLMCALIVILFLGGWNIPFLSTLLSESICFSLKMSLFIFFFVWVRATFPRYRYDQLMHLCWRTFLPISFVYYLFTVNILILFDGLPSN